MKAISYLLSCRFFMLSPISISCKRKNSTPPFGFVLSFLYYKIQRTTGSKNYKFKELQVQRIINSKNYKFFTVAISTGVRSSVAVSKLRANAFAVSIAVIQ